jgi:hypothetical protein
MQHAMMLMSPVKSWRRELQARDAHDVHSSGAAKNGRSHQLDEIDTHEI